MRGVVKCLAVLVLAGAALLPVAGQEKKDQEKAVVVRFDPNDFPPGGSRVVVKEEEVNRKAEACKAKYEGKQVRVIGMRLRLPDEKEPKQYTLRITYPLRRPNQPVESVFVDVDFIPAKVAPELEQKSRSGLIVEVVGKGKIDARGRLLLDEARVLGTNIPPG